MYNERKIYNHTIMQYILDAYNELVSWIYMVCLRRSCFVQRADKSNAHALGLKGLDNNSQLHAIEEKNLT